MIFDSENPALVLFHWKLLDMAIPSSVQSASPIAVGPNPIAGGWPWRATTVQQIPYSLLNK